MVKWVNLYRDDEDEYSIGDELHDSLEEAKAVSLERVSGTLFYLGVYLLVEIPNV